MAIPRLNEKLCSNGKYVDAEPGYTVLVEIISHVKVTNILHFYEDFLDRIIYSRIDFYPQPLNNMILEKVHKIILEHKRILFTCFDAVCRNAGFDISFLYCDNFSCMNNIKYHSLPLSIRNWFHKP